MLFYRYGPWMDTNMVIPTSPSTCTVVYDYYLEKKTLLSLGENADTFLSDSLAASDQVMVTFAWVSSACLSCTCRCSRRTT